MANTNQAKKRVRQAESRRVSNSSQKSSLRKEIKKYKSSDSSNNASFTEVQGHIARAAQKGLIPKNRASRLTSRLNSAAKKAVTS